MTNLKALLLTIFVGVFFLIGIGVTKLTSRKKELTLFATGMAFVVMMGMVLFDIIPEIKENLDFFPRNTKWLWLFGWILFGMLLLKGLDLFIPHHHHEHQEEEKDKTEHNEHLFHIGFITSISLILHNIIEGLSIYVASLTNFKTGLFMTLAVSLHNIPLGIEIALSMESEQKKKKTKYITIAILSLSSFLGAFFLFLLKREIPEILLTSLLCITLGMLLYIALFELLKEIWNNSNNKSTYYGMVFGLILMFVMVIV